MSIKAFLWSLKISINDFIGVTNGLKAAIETGDKEFAEKAVANNGALQKLGLDIVIGDITQQVDDISRYAGKENPDFTGEKEDKGTTWGAKLVFSI